MRCLVPLVLLAACSKSGYPELTDAVAKRIHQIAPECEEKPGNPGPPHGYHTEVWCQNADRTVRVLAYLVDDKDSLGELTLFLEVPLEQAIDMTTAALPGLIDAKELELVKTALREGKPDEVGGRVLPIKRMRVRTSVDTNYKNLPSYTVTLRWEP